jgi:tripartite-type tricarboxylate transporter receptor subunit TctC
MEKLPESLSPQSIEKVRPMNKRTFAVSRRRFLRTSVAFAGAAPLFVRPGYAAWPDRPVKLVVPFGPGGPVDVIARLLQPLLADELKANFFIENKPGAAGSIGVGQVARAEPDGYTVLVTSNTIMINPLLYKSVPYDLEKDFIPLADMAGSPTAYTVNPKSGIKTVADFVAFAKEKKGDVNYGSAGFATPSHLAGEFFKNRAGIEMAHVPFNGAGTLTGIAVTGEKRWFDLPNVPTMVEAGYPGFVLDTYTLMLVPTQTPADVVERLSGAARTILQKSEVRDKLRAVGLEVTAGGPAELKARFARELPLWRDIVQISGITPQ